MKKKYIPHRGDILWLNFDPILGKEISKRRPALVLSPKEYNQYGKAIVVPITSQEKGYPFEVKINQEGVKGVVLVDSVRSVDWIEREAKFICSSSSATFSEVLKKLASLLIRNPLV